MTLDYSIADQRVRFARARAEQNTRILDIDRVYDGSLFRDQRGLVTGANRGIGLALVRELLGRGTRVIGSCRQPDTHLPALAQEHPNLVIAENVDVTDEDAVVRLASEISEPLDILINNAGYFYGPLETLSNLNFAEELRMIDICAVGPLRVTAALHNAARIKFHGGKVAMITSQGGSIAWRTTQNPTGHDDGHHMSKAAANMMSVLLAQELKGCGISVRILHPGFNKTEMTNKYAGVWEEEGAVEPAVGAKRILHEIFQQSLESTGCFINCEDGLQIPW